MNIAKGKLYLVPAPLDFGCDSQAPLQDVMPLGTLQIAARLFHHGQSPTAAIMV